MAALLKPGLVLRSHRRHLTVELAGRRTRGQVVRACVGPTCPDTCRGPGAPIHVLDAFDLDAFKDLLLSAAQHWTRPDPPLAATGS